MTPAGTRIVACLKFGAGFAPDYANVLHRAVREHLGAHRFVCLTDDPAGLDPGIEPLPIADFGLPRARWTENGNWPKIALFAPGLFADDARVMYLDVDVLVAGRLEPFFDRAEAMGGCHLLAEWSPPLWSLAPPMLRPDRGAQGSVIVWRPGEQAHVFDAFRADPERVLASNRGDRSYWTRVVRGPRYLPRDWCASFKRHSVHYYPISRLTGTPRKPGWPRLIVFHGRPEPMDLLGPPGRRWGTRRKFGFAPVPWVVDYWRRYGGSLPP